MKRCSPYSFRHTAARWMRRSGVPPWEVAAQLGHSVGKEYAVTERYGAWVEKSMYGKKYMGVARATFIIGPDGKIAKVFPKVQPKKHDDLVLKALGELAAA